MLRNVFTGVVRHGRKVLEGILQKGEAVKPTQKTQDCVRLEAKQIKQQLPTGQTRSQGFVAQYLKQYDRQNLAAELRRRFSRQVPGGSAQGYGSYRGLAQKLSLAFVGIGMANNGGIEKSRIEDGFGSVCAEVKGLLRENPGNAGGTSSLDRFGGDHWTDFEVGSMIAKGCNAAVYEARLKCPESVAAEESKSLSVDGEDITDELMSDFEVIPERSEPSLSSLAEIDNLAFDLESDDHEADSESDIEVLDHEEEPSEQQIPYFMLDESEDTLNAVPFNHNEANRFDLAVKIMFNYDAESCATAILNTMKHELIPAVNEGIQGQEDNWQNGHRAKMKASVPERLPPHPNIVAMWGAFVDDMPALPEALTEFPIALPRRLNQDGCGRNKTMFLVMKKYELTLREYLAIQSPALPRSMLLLTQLVEAVIHMGNHSLAHRDLKSDNLLILSSDDPCPQLVVSDFGCCLDGRQHTFGLRVPYLTEHMCKGGNGALMAPEISSASSGTFSLLDFRKSDLWAVGTLSYEIFGAHNPFYRDENGRRLDSTTYRDEDLPSLPVTVGRHLERIIQSMLHRNPAQRPDAIQVGDMLHILLWAPQDWVMTLLAGSRPCRPSEVEVMRWILQLFAEVTFEKLGPKSNSMEHKLKCLFLGRLDFHRIMHAFECLWSY